MKAARGSGGSSLGDAAERDLGGGYRLRFAGFEEMDAAALHALLKLRFDVFVMEQQSLYPEIDGADPDAVHAILSHGRPRRVVGTLRILGLGGPGDVKIGRVAVAEAHRATGVGSAMLRKTLAEIEVRAPGRIIVLGAQLQLEAFYAGFGFARISEIYDDGGIRHVDMARRPA